MPRLSFLILIGAGVAVSPAYSQPDTGKEEAFQRSYKAALKEVSSCNSSGLRRSDEILNSAQACDRASRDYDEAIRLAGSLGMPSMATDIQFEQKLVRLTAARLRSEASREIAATNAVQDQTRRTRESRSATSIREEELADLEDEDRADQERNMRIYRQRLADSMAEGAAVARLTADIKRNRREVQDTGGFISGRSLARSGTGSSTMSASASRMAGNCIRPQYLPDGNDGNSGKVFWVQFQNQCNERVTTSFQWEGGTGQPSVTVHGGQTSGRYSCLAKWGCTGRLTMMQQSYIDR